MFQFLIEAYARFRQRRTKLQIQQIQRAFPKLGEVGLDNMVFLPPEDRAWIDAWRVTEALFSRMRDEVRSHDAEFWIVTLTSGIQVYPDPEVRHTRMEKLGVDTLVYPDMRIKGFADREGIPLITLVQPFLAYAEANRTFLHGFDKAKPGGGHWNERGHRLAGEIIARRLCAAQVGEGAFKTSPEARAP